MSTQTPPFPDTGLMKRSVHEHWRAFLAEGIILVLLGLCAIIVPVFAGLAATIILGWVFLIGGIAALVSTFAARRAPGFGWSLASAIIAILAGLALLWNPVRGLVTLTYVLTAYFIVDGLVMIALGFAHRRELAGRWEWIALNGVIDLVLAAIIIVGLPGSAAWVLGVLLGIDLVYGGAALISMALAAR